MKPSEQAEMKEMKMTRNYSYGDIITILYKMSMGGWRKEGLRFFLFILMKPYNPRIQIWYWKQSTEICNLKKNKNPAQEIAKSSKSQDPRYTKCVELWAGITHTTALLCSNIMYLTCGDVKHCLPSHHKDSHSYWRILYTENRILF